MNLLASLTSDDSKIEQSVIAQQQKANDLLTTQNHTLQAEYDLLKKAYKIQQEKIDLIQSQYDALMRQLIDLKQQHFGSKTEKYIPEQALLFDRVVTDDPEPETEHMVFDRKKPCQKRHPHHIIPDEIPRVRIEYTLNETQQICPCGCGRLLKKTGEVISERLEYKRPELYVNQHVRFKYAGCLHDSCVLTADMPTLPLARSIAGPSLMSQIIVDKYEYHQPLHRQRQRFKQMKILLNKNSLYDWSCQMAEILKILYTALQKEVLLAPIVNTDDTPAKVRILGEDKAKKGYFWIYVGHGTESAAAVYIYTENRKGEGPQTFLGAYEGTIQADAYSGYDLLFDKKNKDHPRQEAGCFMHARRRFYKIVSQSKKTGAAHQAMSWVQALYKIEAHIKSASPEERLRIRQEESQPILNEFKTWLDTKINQALPSSPLFDAVQYSLNHWAALTRFMDDGKLEIDNGKAERGMRPIALGRNNWICLGSHYGGWMAALYYSFIESCKIHQINTYDYFTDVLTRINDHPVNRLKELLPYYWKKNQALTKTDDPPDDTS
jgi:transposase